MIRKLEHGDADAMLEWMHDKDTIKAFRFPFEQSTRESVISFIDSSFSELCQHFAIVDKHDEYLGTVSLKNISKENKCAEYAIVVRKIARGTGVARQATEDILDYAFNVLGLHKVYLNVLENNECAKRFYQKCGFMYEGTAKDAIVLNGDYASLAWYGKINEKEQIKKGSDEMK